MSRYVATAKRRYRADDVDMVDTVVTTRDPDTGDLMRCAVEGCGYVVEVLWQELPAYLTRRKIPHCAECRGDRRVLELLHPAPAQVERLRELRAAGEAVPEDRRRTAA